MKKIIVALSGFLLSNCVTINYPEQHQYTKSPIPERLPPIGDNRCDASCRTVCSELYMPDLTKYSDCVIYQDYAEKEWMPFRGVHMNLR
jgi:hypothetical protein